MFINEKIPYLKVFIFYKLIYTFNAVPIKK